MTNHIHLIIQTGEVSLSHIMQSLSLRYTKWINYTQARTGHVFQGRYKALLLDADTYLLELVRYVHLNPVRAGIATSPDEYLWSSHHGYLGHEIIPWLTTDWVLSLFSADIRQARSAYSTFVIDGIGEPRRAEFHSGTCEGRILGDDHFTDEAFNKADQRQEENYQLDDVISAVCRLYGVTIEQLQAPGKSRPLADARATATLLVLELPGLRLTELGKMLKRDNASLSRAGRRLAEKAHKDECLNRHINELRRELAK
jgi:hypothetical protein